MTLQEQRLSLGLTQAQMAEAVNVSLATWQKWELFDDPKGRARCALDRTDLPDVGETGKQETET